LARPKAKFESVGKPYEVDDAIATIMLNRPDRLKTIVPPMPDEIEAAIHRAVAARDGAFGDYSQVPREEQPNRSNVIGVKDS
jgi:1,4-dihydroxy-2-naphthoyl-CoA synthase